MPFIYWVWASPRTGSQTQDCKQDMQYNNAIGQGRLSPSLDTSCKGFRSLVYITDAEQGPWLQAMC